MNQLIYLIQTATLLVMFAGAGDSKDFLPLDKCLNKTARDNMKRQFCSDLNMTTNACRTNKEQIKNCKRTIMSGVNSTIILNTAAGCLESVANITVPDIARNDTAEFKIFIVTNIRNNRQAVCNYSQPLLDCIKTNTNMTQLIKDCLKKNGVL
ncbi:uncharacterized protein [Cherax quadricarinatus]|uniref:uncharacterized protein n=1 Tax=Cherax quadricarinatus TaxID=27406 RepID=UPI002379F6EB|nr:uncharacterized protein LOC128700268 [Cherax quadricarinatus]